MNWVQVFHFFSAARMSAVKCQQNEIAWAATRWTLSPAFSVEGDEPFRSLDG